MPLVLLLGACGGDPQSPQERIEAQIGALEEAVEDGSLRTTAGLIHPGYSDRLHPDRASAIRTLFAYLRRHSTIHLFVRVHTIELDPGGDAARAVVHVAMTGVPVESAQALVSVKADLYRFDVDLRLEDDAWLVSGSRWRRAGPGEF